MTPGSALSSKTFHWYARWIPHSRDQHFACPGSLVECDRFCAPLQFLLELDQEECIRRHCDESDPNPLSKEACRTLAWWPAHAKYLKDCVGALGNRVTRFKSPANEVRVCSEVWVIRMHGLCWGECRWKSDTYCMLLR